VIDCAIVIECSVPHNLLCLKLCLCSVFVFVLYRSQHECCVAVHQCHSGFLLHSIYSLSLRQLAETPYPCYVNHVRVLVLSIHDSIRHAYWRLKCKYVCLWVHLCVLCLRVIPSKRHLLHALKMKPEPIATLFNT